MDMSRAFNGDAPGKKDVLTSTARTSDTVSMAIKALRNDGYWGGTRPQLTWKCLAEVIVEQHFFFSPVLGPDPLDEV